MSTVAAAVALCVGFVTYVGLRLKVTYNLRYEVVELREQLDQTVARDAIFHKGLEKRLDDIERFLFGDVLASLVKAEQAAAAARTPVQIWQRNRDKELRDQITSLERLRLKDAQRIEQLEREIQAIKREIRDNE